MSKFKKLVRNGPIRDGRMRHGFMSESVSKADSDTDTTFFVASNTDSDTGSDTHMGLTPTLVITY